MLQKIKKVFLIFSSMYNYRSSGWPWMRPNSKYQLSYTQKDRFKHDITVSLKNIYLLNSRKYHLATIFLPLLKLLETKTHFKMLLARKHSGHNNNFGECNIFNYIAFDKSETQKVLGLVQLKRNSNWSSIATN